MAACTSIFSAPWRVVLSAIWTANLLVSAQEVVLPIPAETSFVSDTGRTEYDDDYDTSGSGSDVPAPDYNSNWFYGEFNFTWLGKDISSGGLEIIIVLGNIISGEERNSDIGFLIRLIPWLDSLVLRVANPECDTTFSLVTGSSKNGYAIYSTPDNITAMGRTEILAALRSRKTENALLEQNEYRGLQLALDELPLRAATSRCVVARSIILISNAPRPFSDYGDESGLAAMYHRLNALQVVLHTVVPGKYSVAGKTVPGRNATLGYFTPQSEGGFTNGYTCVSSSPNVSSDTPDLGSFKALGQLALDLGGSSWDVDLHTLEDNDIKECGILDHWHAQLTNSGLSCYYCQSTSSGQERCAAAREKDHDCRCTRAGGFLRDGQCWSADGQWIAVDGIPPPPAPPSTEPGPSHSNIVIIAAVFASGIGLVTMSLVSLVLYRRRSSLRKLPTAKNLRTLADKEYNGPSIQTAAYHMMAMLAAPGASRLKVIPTDILSFSRCIGQGQFGEVYLGTWHTTEDSDHTKKEDVPVAIKILPDTGEKDLELSNALLEEYFLQQALGEHSNIVKFLLGGLYRGQPCIVMEYMDGGDLHGFLRNVKGIRRLSVPECSHTGSLPEVEKLDITSQIARGLEFMASQKIVHRDIATRNVLLREHKELPGKLIAKISDWGLSRKAILDGVYQSQTSRKLPMKWMSIESISQGIFSEKSDVWAFGVLVWEIESSGETPYSGIPNALLLHLLENGQRLERPHSCSLAIHSLMMQCWDNDPEERPTFERLASELSQLLQEETHYITVLEDSTSRPGSQAAAKDYDDASPGRRSRELSLDAYPSTNHSFNNVDVQADSCSHDRAAVSRTLSRQASLRYVRQPIKRRMDFRSSRAHSTPGPSLRE